MNESSLRMTYGCLRCLVIVVALAVSGAFAPVPLWADDGVDAVSDNASKAGAAPVVLLENAAVTESSGLAFSNLSNDRLWTHNDSGDTARLFAFDRGGKTTGGCELVGVDAVDFEDMASFVQDSLPRLVVADVGDNRSVRPFVSLYFFDEPSPDQQTSVTQWTRIDVRYADGPRDCEAIAVDAQRGIVTLVTKSFLPVATVYELPLPNRSPLVADGAAAKPAGVPAAADAQVLRPVAKLPIPLVTAIDRDPATGDLLVINYFQLFRYSGGVNEKPWWQSSPSAVDLPRLKQIEAVAVDRSGDVWVTSEASPTPLAKVQTFQK